VAAFWPAQGDQDPFARFFNSHPEVRRLELAHVRRVEQHVDHLGRRRRELRALRDAEGLVDELRVFLHPIVVGHGARLFEDTTSHGLELVGQQTWATGVLNLAYAPKG